MSADHNNKIDNTNTLFPFAAVVNQEKAKEALLLAVINPAVHGVLFLGEKGTGKTTRVRSLSTLLPETQVIDLPLGSGEEMVLGTVDAEKALALLQGAKARAAWYERDSVSWEDIQTVMPLALQHRITTVDIQSPVTWDLLNERLLEINSKPKDEDKKGWFPTPFYRKKKAETRSN